MARDTQERSVRRDPSMREGTRDVQLQSTNRFFTAQGNDSAFRQARALQQALGVGVEFYGEHLERQNTKGVARAAQEAAAGGTRNADDTNKGYNETYDRVEAANDLAIFEKDLPTMLDEMDWSTLPEDEVQAKIDEYYKGQLQGINPDSVYGKTVAQGILNQNAKLLEVHRTAQQERDKQEKRIMVFNATKRQLETLDLDPESPTLTTDLEAVHKQLMTDLNTLLPGRGGRTTYLESVAQLSEELGLPELLETVPERFPNGEPTGKTDPNLKDFFDDSTLKSENKRKTDLAEADKKYEDAQRDILAQLHAQDKEKADMGDPSVLADIFEGTRRGPNNEPPRYTQAEATNLHIRYANARRKMIVSSSLAEEYAAGNLNGQSQEKVDEGHNAFVDQKLREKPDDVDEADWQNAVQYMALERSVPTGKLPSVYKAAMGVSPGSQPEKFKQAAEMYEQLNAIEPGFAEIQLGPRQSRTLDAYDRMLAETGGDEAKAMELLRAYDPTLHTGTAKEITAGVDSAVERLNNMKPGWGDYNTNPQLVRQVRKEVEFYVDMGFDPEQATMFAVEHMSKRFTRVGDYMYEKDVGWGSKPQEVHDWVIQQEAERLGIDPDQLSITPAADNRYIRIQKEGTILPSTDLFRIDTLAGNYATAMNDDLNARLELLETSSDEKLAEAERRAYDAAYPFDSYLRSGERAAMNKIQRQQWEDMDPAIKQQLIAKQLKLK